MNAESIMSDNERTNRYLRRLAFSFGSVLLVVSALGAGSTVKLVTESKKQSEHNGKLMGIVVTVTGCSPDDKPEVCQKRLRDTSIAEGQRRIREVDCRTYRAIAGLPRLPADVPCDPVPAVTGGGPQEVVPPPPTTPTTTLVPDKEEP